jgi:hypothetical protein
MVAPLTGCPDRPTLGNICFLLKHVLGKVITERVEDAFRSLGLRVIAFVNITGMATIDKITHSICAAP